MTRHVGLGDLEPGPWWIAHEHPERPVDNYCVWSWDCDPCMLHLIASARYAPDCEAEEFREHNGPTVTNVSDTLHAARLWREGNGLPRL